MLGIFLFGTFISFIIGYLLAELVIDSKLTIIKFVIIVAGFLATLSLLTPWGLMFALISFVTRINFSLKEVIKNEELQK